MGCVRKGSACWEPGVAEQSWVRLSVVLWEVSCLPGALAAGGCGQMAERLLLGSPRCVSEPLWSGGACGLSVAAKWWWGCCLFWVSQCGVWALQVLCCCEDIWLPSVPWRAGTPLWAASYHHVLPGTTGMLSCWALPARALLLTSTSSGTCSGSSRSPTGKESLWS